jgi:hypothetical protein
VPGRLAAGGKVRGIRVAERLHTAEHVVTASFPVIHG